MAQCTEEKFMGEVKDHDLTIIYGNGLNRHITLSNKGSYNAHYDIVTWYNHLCIAGDYGTYVFSRTDDMFDFFWNDKSFDELRINPGYWHAKMQADSRFEGAQKFSYKEFKRSVIWDFKSFWDGTKNKDARKECWEELESRVLNCGDENEQDCMRAACDFEYGEYSMQDFWETDCKKYTYQFIWCLYAIVYAIRRFKLETE